MRRINLFFMLFFLSLSFVYCEDKNDAGFTTVKQFVSSALDAKDETLTEQDLYVYKQYIPELDILTNEQDIELLYPAFFVMAKRGDNSSLKFFIKKGININKKNDFDMTALLEALKANKDKTVKFLLKKDADPKIITKNGINAIRLAVENNNEKMLKLFLKKGVNPSQKDVLGKTPIIVSIEKNYYKLTKILLKELKGFDIDMQDRNGKSLLMAAIENNDIELAENLIKRGINVWLVNSKGEDALSIAEKHNNKKLTEMLRNIINKERKDSPKIDQWVRKPGEQATPNN